MQLPRAIVVFDREKGIWDTGRRALLAYDRDADFHLCLQDDAILCRDFVERAQASLAGDGPVSLWLSEEVAEVVGARRERGWFFGPGPWGGVAIALPTKDIPALVKWADEQTVDSYDKRISRFYGAWGKPCRYVLPSLVDHRSLAENPSLVGRQVDSRAFWFEP